MYTLNANTGLLTATSTAKITIVGTGSQGIAVDGQGRFVYTADTDSNTVSSLIIDQTTGVLSPTSVPSAMASKWTDGVNTDASGKYVYASNKGDGSISQFVIDQTTGNLTPNKPALAAGGGGAFAGIINSAGTVFYSPGPASDYVAVLAIPRQVLLSADRPMISSPGMDPPRLQ
jgi:6-phosphogluconolactonase (cycloisomerase 2 family)